MRRLNLQAHPLFNGSAPTSRGPLQLARDAKDALAVGMRRAMGASPAVPVDRSTADETAIESGLISQFLAGLQIVPEKSTRLVAIVYTAPSAEFAALAANTVAEEYAQQNLDLRLDAINKNAALSAQRASVIDAARNEYESALIEERSLGSQLEGQKTAAMDLDRKSGRYLVLQREAESNRSVYQALLQQEKELRVVSNSRNNNVQLMDRAEIPGAPFSPNARRDWFTALLAGLLAAVGLAFLLEYLDDTVRTPEDVSKRLNLALLGIVPAVRGPSVPLLSEQVPLEFGEAFRSLRTSIAFTSTVNGPRVVAVTSSQPLEGKTTTACNLATALAIGGSRVLLVDADMRRAGLHKLVGAVNEKDCRISWLAKRTCVT